jgi:amino-acid N-acetyltransferase
MTDAAVRDPVVLVRAEEDDVEAIAALNNRYVAQGLTLPRSPDFVRRHLDDYQVLRDATGRVVGCVAVDEYSPSLAELVSLAVAPDAQGRGYGKVLIQAAIRLAERRGYALLFAVSFSDALFLSQGFAAATLEGFPEKKARYEQISREEILVAKKHCFVRPLHAAAGAA